MAAIDSSLPFNAAVNRKRLQLFHLLKLNESQDYFKSSNLWVPLLPSSLISL